MEILDQFIWSNEPIIYKGLFLNYDLEYVMHAINN